MEGQLFLNLTTSPDYNIVDRMEEEIKVWLNYSKNTLYGIKPFISEDRFNSLLELISHRFSLREIEETIRSLSHLNTYERNPSPVE